MKEADSVSISDLKKSYALGDTAIQVLKGVSVNLPSGKLITLMGPSGSGKSTLMHILSGIDRPDSGTIEVFGKNLGEMNEKEITIFRRHTIGIIFQFFNLMPYLSALENTALPLFLSGSSGKEALRLAHSSLEKVGLKKRMSHKPNELSGGEQQRVAIARAICGKPKILLADEPTGNLDTKNSFGILDILKKLQKEEGYSLLMITHNPEIGKLGDIRLKMKDGRLSS